MINKTTIALAMFIATASSALAAVKHQSPADPGQSVYVTRGTYLGADPDANVRFELRRDEARGQN